MQNPTTGELFPVKPEEMDELRAQLQQKFAQAHPGRPIPEPGIFELGEILVIKGCRFRIKAIGQKFMRLEGLPGVKVL